MAAILAVSHLLLFCSCYLFVGGCVGLWVLFTRGEHEETSIILRPTNLEAPTYFEKIQLLNPFNPRERRSFPVTLEPGQALLDYVTDDGEHIISILNGKVIPPGQRALVIPRAGDQLIVAQELAGGDGGGKQILRSIALIAVAVLATAFGGPLGAAIGLHGALALALGSAAIMVAGSIIVNFAVPLPKPTETTNSQSYSWAGAVMSVGQGTPISRGFGKFSPSWKVIDSYTHTQGDKQYLNLLLCAGFGPCVEIDDVKINGNPISDYPGVTHETRRGTNDQTPISYFRDTVSERGQSARLRTGATAVIVTGDRSDTQALEVEFFFPKGIWAGPNSDGSFDNWTVYGKVEYKLTADSTWNTAIFPGVTVDVGSTPFWIAILQTQSNGVPLIIVYATSNGAGDHQEGDPYNVTTTVNVYDHDGNFIGTQQQIQVATWTKNPGNPSTGAAAMGSTPQTVSQWHAVSFYEQGNTQTMRRHVVRIDNLPAGHYDVRVSKIGTSQNPGEAFWSPITEDTTRRGEEMWLGSIREIIYDDLTYPNMILLGVRALATDQLSGGGVNVTATVFWGDDNPSKVAQQMMTNTLWGGGIDPAILDQPKFDEWEEFCDSTVSDGDGGLIKQATWNGVFDTTDNLWSQLAKVCAIARASIVRTGLNYSVIIDKATDPVQLFTVGNILRDSFKENWLALDSRANSIDLAYNDVDDDYTRKPFTVEDIDAITAGDPIRKAPMLDAIGITSAAQAFHEGNYRLKSTKLLTRTVEFEAPVEAITCSMGDRITVQHDVPQWGAGGKIVSAADTTHIKLDRVVTMTVGKTYSIIIVYPTLRLASGNTVSISGKNVVLNAPPATTHPIMRLTLPDGEFEVAGISGANITLAKASTSTGVKSYILSAVDAMEDRVVVAATGDGGYGGTAEHPGFGELGYGLGDSLDSADMVVSPGFPAIPPKYATYTFGEVTKEGKDFRVAGMSRSSDLEWTIRGIEYRDELYDAVDPLIPPSPNGSVGIAVSNLDAHEAFSPGASQPLIAVGWTPGKYTVGADVYIGSADFFPTAPSVIKDSGGGLNSMPVDSDFYIRITYVKAGGGETGPSNSVKIVGDSNSNFRIRIYDRSAPDPTYSGWNAYVAVVPTGDPEPALSGYQKQNTSVTALGSLTGFFIWAVVSNGALTTTQKHGNLALVATVLRRHDALITGRTAGSYIVTVVGYDAAGKRASVAASPSVSVLILGSGGLPGNVTSFRAAGYVAPNVTAVWDAISDDDLDHYEIRYQYAFDGVLWERATSIDSPNSTATTATLTKGPGTYLIKAINTAGRESGVASMFTVGRADVRATPDPDPDPLPRGGLPLGGPGRQQTNVF